MSRDSCILRIKSNSGFVSDWLFIGKGLVKKSLFSKPIIKLKHNTVEENAFKIDGYSSNDKGGGIRLYYHDETPISYANICFHNISTKTQSYAMTDSLGYYITTDALLLTSCYNIKIATLGCKGRISLKLRNHEISFIRCVIPFSFTAISPEKVKIRINKNDTLDVTINGKTVRLYADKGVQPLILPH